MINKPLVSILMPVYNAEVYVRAAVDSILNQSYEDWELIIVDDASSDNSLMILNEFVDKRIVIIRNEINLGLSQSLRIAIKVAKGDYYARADADDISLPDRLAKQIEFLERNKKCCLLGTWAETIDSRGNKNSIILRSPSNDSALKASLFFSCPFLHPSIVVRSSVLEDHAINYSAEIRQAEDYVLYADLLVLGDFANLAEPLIYYRVHHGESRITSDRNSADIISGRKVAWRIIVKSLGMEADDALLSLHDKLTYYPDRITREDARVTENYLSFLITLRKANDIHGRFDLTLFAEQVSFRMYHTLLHPLVSINKSLKWYARYGGYLMPAQRLKFPAAKLRNSLLKTS